MGRICRTDNGDDYRVGNGRVIAILVASGKSERFGTDKLEIDLGGVSVWEKSYRALRDSGVVDGVGVVTRAEKVAQTLARVPDMEFVVTGGETRAESVRRGLAAVPAGFEIVLVHDAARPFVSAEVIERVVAVVREHGAAYPAVGVTDTIRHDGQLLDRTQLLAAQTPQGARLDDLRSAMMNPAELTDEMAYLQANGVQIFAVEGDPANQKITHPGDVKRPMEIRTGFGYDVHRFSDDPARPLWLGGVEFDDRPGLEGHSDADALLHAIVDALLGAAALGDIGVHYPPSDPQWKDCPSLRFVGETGEMLRRVGWEIVNVDATVVAERPKVMVKALEIRTGIAGALGIEVGRVSVKATTNERLGAIGNSEGIAGYAVATISRK
ncbi:2-C-methyl-D-erythritol 2,4-cyclodiphosphate synthase [Armatimonadetes bacterium Uphvl-Ar1]|nr:2-C-methyl-D-erythritol 2,4-cyclodiphosphate synthase [Armatimonadetes bacterium Uphvl-Ar1]